MSKLNNFEIKAITSIVIGSAPLAFTLLFGQSLGFKAMLVCGAIWPIALAWTSIAARREKRRWRWLLLLIPFCYWPVTLAIYVFLCWLFGSFAP